MAEPAPGGSVSWESWELWLVRVTERYLSWRRKRRLERKARQKKRNQVVDWLDAILSAVVIVLVINQYLLQAYQIPSPSMEPSLLVTDRIFVNKIVYGPELIPGMLKIPGPWKPQRGDVIIFESPEYISSGPVVDILQRIIYMVTLSLVDIDKDENGQPKHHFLIKRAIGMPGDRIRMNEGNVEILPPGASAWIAEPDMKKAMGFDYQNVRIPSVSGDYPVFKEAGIAAGLVGEKLRATTEEEAAVKKYYRTTSDSSGTVTGVGPMMQLADDIYVQMWTDATRWAIEPDNLAAGAEWRMLAEGYYVPEGRLFPMGDNRDNSHDARYFGPVRLEKVLGKALFRYWPLYRIGGVR
ncbi:MAG TPA: signal peptidase I [Spirochaetia bacterium]|nr:signal peptidase I [Spirochaetia bacterium]